MALSEELTLESNNNMDTGKLTVIIIGQIEGLKHTDMKIWPKVRS
jgi:hypothetical protein